MPQTQERPTKKQYEMLRFIESYVSEHGYGPSYREIMVGCNYTSVATVAQHVSNLITRGHLRKKGRAARSLEVIKDDTEPQKIQTTAIKPGEEKWLIEKIDYRFRSCEDSESVDQAELDGLYVLVGSLKVLALDGAAQSFMPRLAEIKKRAA